MRVFKTRTIATDACKKGRVSMGDGTVVKPSRTIDVGDIIKVRKPPITYTFRVKALTENRLGAKLVPDYLENLTPKSEYDLLEVVKISGFIDRQKGLADPPNAKVVSCRALPKVLATTAGTLISIWTTMTNRLNDTLYYAI